MNAIRLNYRSARQQGMALMMVVGVLILLAVTGVIISLNSTAVNNQRAQKTVEALGQAKAALIGRAMVDDTRPGSFLCPDNDNDGSAEILPGGECAGGYVGRLPWRTLGLPDLRDGYGERLWYALSRSVRDASGAQPLNSDTLGQLNVTGSITASNIVAIVFSSGPPLGGQVRDAANILIPANYLEGGNEDGDNNYVANPNNNIFNDQLLLITHEDVFPLVEKRIAQEARNFLSNYYATNNYFPFANAYTDGTHNCTPTQMQGRLPMNIATSCPGLAGWDGGSLPAWFTNNNWHLLTYYAVAAPCQHPNLNCSGAGGLITVNGASTPNNNKQAVVIVAGRRIGTQNRPCVNVSDCLDSTENTNGDDIYEMQTRSVTFNDTVATKP